MTSIYLPGSSFSGVSEYGNKTVSDMLVSVRAYAVAQKKEAEEILASLDSDFRVETHLGIHAKTDKKILQEGKTP